MRKRISGFLVIEARFLCSGNCTKDTGNVNSNRNSRSNAVAAHGAAFWKYKFSGRNYRSYKRGFFTVKAWGIPDEDRGSKVLGW
jgi:hypothetical protein